MRHTIPVILFCAAVSITALIAQSRSVWDGVYTDDQAKRGQTIAGEECGRCHSANLLGGENAPELAGESFRERWNGQTLGDLFEKIRTTMPTDSPGRLSRQDYSDVLAYILSVNKYPAGSKELDKDADPLKQIKIEAKK